MRYVGSKRRFAPYLLPFIQKALQVYPKGLYIEPFIGGANMITEVKHHTRIGYDANKYLIALLRQAQQNPDSLAQAKGISKTAFNYIKTNKDEFFNWYVGAVGFFSTYCSKWMESYIEHIRTGNFDGSKKCLLKQNLSGIHLVNSDYKTINVGKGNVIYCDPPYKDTTDFYKMNFDHEEFYEWVRIASSSNIVFVSEYHMPSDFKCVWKKEMKPGITSKAKPRFEKLFMYKK
jgi:DNA adenine methylase